MPSHRTPSDCAPRDRRRDTRSGYALIELILALTIASLLAALALPWPAGRGGASELRAAATRVAVLLRSDRNAALRGGRPIVTGIDLPGRAIRSGAGEGAIALPRYRIEVSESLARGVRFDPDGRAGGGEIVLAALEGAPARPVILRIDPDTAAVEIRAGDTPDAR